MAFILSATSTELTSWMKDVFSLNKAPISKVFYCPNHPDGIGRYRKVDSNRKPGPGMLLKAKDELDLDLSSILVGDKISDILAGHTASVEKIFYLEALTTKVYVRRRCLILTYQSSLR